MEMRVRSLVFLNNTGGKLSVQERLFFIRFMARNVDTAEADSPEVCSVPARGIGLPHVLFTARRHMRKRGLCCRPVSVCLSVTFVYLLF